MYCKYEFETLLKILQPVLDENGEQIKPHSIDGDVVIIGNLVQKEGIYDEEGNELTPAVISDKIAVDILYKGDPEPSLEPYRVNPSHPKHTIAGMEHLYQPQK